MAKASSEKLPSARDRKLHDLAAILNDHFMSIASDQGGYPAVVTVIPGFICVAETTDGDEPTLDIYSAATAARWLRDIKKWRRTVKDDAESAVFETQPEADF